MGSDQRRLSAKEIKTPEQPAMHVSRTMVVAMIDMMATVWSGFCGAGVGVSFIVSLLGILLNLSIQYTFFLLGRLRKLGVVQLFFIS
jgi:hypothetical protein